MTQDDTEALPSTPYHPADGYAEDSTEFHLPPEHWPLPELVHLDAPHGEPSTSAFVAAHETAEFARLRRTFRTFAFPMTAAALASYFVYVVASIYAIDFMKQPFLGLRGLNVGMALGLFQFAVVWVWTALYVRFANNKLDAAASGLRERLEKKAVA